jgi:hypothetical protein
MVGQNIVLHTDEPVVGVGCPLRRIRIRVNDVIVPIQSLLINGIFIFVELEDSVTSNDVVTAQYNPESVLPVVDGIIAVDNSEELKAFLLTLAQVSVGSVKVNASIGVSS